MESLLISHWLPQLSLSKDQGNMACHESEGYFPFKYGNWSLVSWGHRVRCTSVATEVPVRPRVSTVCHGTAILHTQRKFIKETEAYSLKFDIKEQKKGVWGWACRSLYEITWYRISALGPWKMPILDPHHRPSAKSKSWSQSGLVLAASIKLSQNKKQNPAHIPGHAFFISPRY